jgi:hypothetical protein
MVEGQRQSSISYRDVDGFREGLKGIGHRFETPCRRASARACPDESSYVARHSAACKRLAIGIGRWQCSVAPATMLEHPFADGNGRTGGGGDVCRARYQARQHAAVRSNDPPSRWRATMAAVHLANMGHGASSETG